MAEHKVLDLTGLTYYNEAIKSYIDDSIETAGETLEALIPDVAQSISSGETGYTNGNQVYVALQDKADDSVFGASGANHSKGLVPDPGATSGTTKFLREDGTWQVPSGGGGGGGEENVIESISVNNVAQPVDSNKNVDITIPVTDVQTSSDGTTYTTVVDANKIAKINLSSYAETSDIPVPAQAMASGDTGYVTGDMLYTIVGDLETFLENY